MRTDRLRINQLSPADWDWYCQYLSAMDARDIDAYARYLADDCELLFNNEPPTMGKAAIVDRLRAYWQSYAGLEHEPLNIYGSSRAFTLEALNHYERLDRKHVTVRAVAFTDRNADGAVTSVRLYTDVSTVFG